MKLSAHLLLAFGFTVLVLGQPAHNAPAEGCTDADSEETSVVQKFAKSHAGVRKLANESHSWEWVEEAFSDVTLSDIQCGASSEGGITRQCWNDAFSKFDKNFDGIITASDLHTMEEMDAKHHHNFTVKDLRAGLALFSQWFPRESARLMTHEPLIVAMAYKGVRPPAGVPEPEDPLAAVPMSALTFRTHHAGANGTALTQTFTESPECIAGVVQLTFGVMGVIFGALAIELPNAGSQILADLITSNPNAQAIIQAVVEMGKKNIPPSATGVAKDVFSIFQMLYNEGIFSGVLVETLNQMSWWDKAVAGATIGTTVASWFATGGAVLVVQLAFIVLDVVDVIEGIHTIGEEC